MHISGQCHCGAVSFEAEAAADAVVICHCSDCQVFAGGPYRAMVRPEPGSLSMTGEPAHYTKTADSGRQRVQGFCGTCGSQLYAMDSDGSKLALRIGAIAQRRELAPPVRQVWCDSALPWAFDLSGIPQTGQQT